GGAAGGRRRRRRHGHASHVRPPTRRRKAATDTQGAPLRGGAYSYRQGPPARGAFYFGNNLCGRKRRRPPCPASRPCARMRKKRGRLEHRAREAHGARGAVWFWGRTTKCTTTSPKY